MTLLSTLAFAQKGTEINLWSEGPRTNNGDPQDTAKVVVFLPDEKKATGRAVVCCPGGGYSHLAWEKEGTSWAPFFNGQGIALIVLKYRMPHGNHTIPAEDAEEAIKLVRKNAEEWHINPKDVGINRGYPCHRSGSPRLSDSVLPCHLHGARYNPSWLTRKLVRQEPQAQAGQ